MNCQGAVTVYVYNRNVARESLYGDEGRMHMGPAPGQAPSDKYQIQRGDTLTKIASRQLGAGASKSDIDALIQKIAKENQIADINRIQAGANLKMPMMPPPSAPGAAPLDEGLAGAPKPGMPLPSAPPPVPPTSGLGGAPYMPRGGEIPQSFPVPMPGTSGGMPGPVPNISMPQPSQVSNTPGGFAPGQLAPPMSFTENQMYGPGGAFDVSSVPPGVLRVGGSNFPPPAALNLPQQGVELPPPARKRKKR